MSIKKYKDLSHDQKKELRKKYTIYKKAVVKKNQISWIKWLRVNGVEK